MSGAMDEVADKRGLMTAAVSRAMIRLHKEQFGRGPTNARTYFAGPDAVVCVLSEALLPAERKLVMLGQQERVRESRTAFQAATKEEFVAVLEQIFLRKVTSFASGIDADADVVFETFTLAPSESGELDGAVA